LTLGYVPVSWWKIAIGMPKNENKKVEKKRKKKVKKKWKKKHKKNNRGKK